MTLDPSMITETYMVIVTITHVLFAVIVLRLYQLVKAAGFGEQSWALRIGVILIVAGTLTLAMIPTTLPAVATVKDVSMDVLIWSLLRTLGLIIVCSLIFTNIARFKPWDGHSERRTGLTRPATLDDRVNSRH